MTPIEAKVNAMASMMLAEDNVTYESAKKALKEAMFAPPGDCDADAVICDILSELGAPDSLLGHDYMVEAIKLCLEDKSCIHYVMSVLYPKTAERCGTTPSRIERALRHLIEVIWRRGDANILYKYFGNSVDCSKGKPTNSEFIARIANVARQRMK